MHSYLSVYSGRSPQRPALGVLHPAVADGSCQVDKASARCAHRAAGAELEAGPSCCQDPTRA